MGARAPAWPRACQAHGQLLCLTHLQQQLHSEQCASFCRLRCSNLFEWAVTILGPPDTLYEGGFFNAVLKFPKDYPQSPPECRFTSEMWHPNGACLPALH